MSRFGRLTHRVSPGPLHEINVTPLVDVMLVLLVLALVGAPLASHRLPLSLPQAAGDPAVSRAALVIGIDAAGTVSLAGRPLPEGSWRLDLARAAAEAVRRQSPAEAHMDADARAPHGRVAEVMAMLRAAGLSRVGWLVRPASP